MKKIIHIGYPKCISTTLQNIWSASDNYDYFEIQDYFLNLKNNFFNDLSFIEKTKNLSITKIQLPNTQKKQQVFSSEIFLSIENSVYENSEIFKLFHQYLAINMSQISEDVLVIVRNPRNLLKSLHAQSIKEGGYKNFSQFLLENNQSLLNFFNLSTIYKIWRKEGFNLKIIPLELYESEKLEFWNILNSEMNIEIPSSYDKKLDKQLSNITNYETIYQTAVFNEMISILGNNLENGYTKTPNKDMLSEKQNLHHMFDHIKNWGSRRAFLDMNLNDKCRIDSLINIKNKEKFFETNLSEELYEMIHSNYINFFSEEKHVKSSILSSYKKCLLN